jgi:hypothetical protein
MVFADLPVRSSVYQIMPAHCCFGQSTCLRFSLTASSLSSYFHQDPSNSEDYWLFPEHIFNNLSLLKTPSASLVRTLISFSPNTSFSFPSFQINPGLPFPSHESVCSGVLAFQQSDSLSGSSIAFTEVSRHTVLCARWEPNGIWAFKATSSSWLSVSLPVWTFCCLGKFGMDSSFYGIFALSAGDI